MKYRVSVSDGYPNPTYAWSKYVEGLLVKFRGFECFEFFAHEQNTEPKFKYRITEVETGMFLAGSDNSIEDAYYQAEIKLNTLGIDRFREGIIKGKNLLESLTQT
jgi:hypothetical protein